ncbi:TetR/AcrR family transcriptional regulator [Exiguobacterium sp. RIT594]|uniref:TetR/AcrR family transcriptional regulator n=1 Tax=Exiguobacterium sp. RIT594 TaxID=2282449 RepID=UPI000DF73048|nr:TetR/AcrR family transcriptional regulator [Exiguobacterium sp. RIT594]RDB31933.1 TetR/AcrR family transcriptional regulator [Exiguobacterium sp. RIT594]
MPKTDRRIAKSQSAIKSAVLALMSLKNFDNITIQDIADEANLNRGTIYLHYTDKYDLLDKMIEEHIHELRVLCHVASDMTFQEGNYIWYEYFEKHKLFFSTMLDSKGAPYFRKQFLELVVEEFGVEVNTSTGKNKGLHEDVILQFFAAATVGAVEWWFKNGMPVSARIMAEQTGILLDRNFD